MKIEQFRHQATTEQLNDRLSKVFGSAIQLDQFTDAQLETARSSVLVWSTVRDGYSVAKLPVEVPEAVLQQLDPCLFILSARQ